MIGYKVVRPVRRRLMSYTAGAGIVRYRVHRTTYREDENGPLAVFTSLEAAQDFISNCPEQRYAYQYKVRIYRCRYKQSATRELFYWWLGEKQRTHSGYVPRDTDFADSVYLLERIPYEISAPEKS